MVIETVGQLIKHLKQFPEDCTLIVDVDGNTFHPEDDDIGYWSPGSADSPVAILTHSWLEV